MDKHNQGDGLIHTISKRLIKYGAFRLHTIALSCLQIKDRKSESSLLKILIKSFSKKDVGGVSIERRGNRRVL